MSEDPSDLLNLKDEEIDRLTLKQTRDFIKRLHIDTAGVTKLQELRRRLKLYVYDKEGRNRGNHASNIVVNIQKKDEYKREQLAALYEDIERTSASIVKMDEDPLPKQLETSIPGFMAKLKKERERLKNKKCPILFAGETSAGKSSLLNLILGDDILPTSHLSNTSVICEISYAEVRSAKIHYWDETKAPDTVEDGENFYAELAKKIHTKEERSKKWPYKKAEIFMPLDILKSGLFIVDSPGIGENQEMTGLVLDYLVEAFAFIYVINSANAGGVQTDRLQALLREVANRKSPDEQQLFQANAAIFVCNKWDQVPIKERELVKRDTLNKLRSCWDGCHEGQLFCMDTAEASYFYKAGYISRDFSKLLDGIEQLVPISLENKVLFSYGWLYNFVTRVLHHLQAFLNQAHKSKVQRMQTYTDIQDRLTKLKKEADQYFDELKNEIESRFESALGTLRQYLLKPEIKERITKWTEPQQPKGHKWTDVDTAIRERVVERITHLLGKWEDEHKFFKQLRPELTEKFTNQFRGIERQLTGIENMIARHDTRMSTASHKDPGEPVNEEEGFFPYDLSLKLKHKIILGVAAPILVPVAVAGAIIALPILGGLKVRQMIDARLAEEKLKKYKSDPLNFLRKQSEKVLDEFVRKSKALEKYVRSELSQAYVCLQQLQEAVPRQIKADEAQIMSLKDDQREASDYLRFYDPLNEVFVAFKKRLLYFKTIAIRRELKDYEYEDIDIPVSQEIVCDSLYCTVFKVLLRKPIGALKTGSEVCLRKCHVPISHQTIHDHLGVEEAYQYQHHENLVKFYGSTRDFDNVYFILEPLKHSLRAYLQDTPNIDWDQTDEEKYQFFLGLMRQVVKGLEYLHSRSMQWVHYDLSLDTVAVDYKGMIKLTNIGHRRMLKIDPSEPHENILRYSHLPHEVLADPPTTYTLSSDMYSVGIMMWEMWTGKRAFEDDITHNPAKFQTLADFIQFCEDRRPGLECFYSNGASEVSSRHAETWLRTLRICWDPEPTTRLTCKGWLALTNKDLRHSDGLYVHERHF